MKKMLLGFLILLVTIGAVSANGTSEGSDNGNADKYIIRYNSTMNENVFVTSPSGKSVLKFIEYVTERSNGRIEVKLFKGGVLGSTSEQVIGGLQTGVFDMSDRSLGAFGEYTQAFMPFNMAYLFADIDQVHAFMEGPMGDKMSDILMEDTGVKLLAYLDMGFRNVTNNVRPIKTPEDIKGLKIRTQTDPYQITAFKVLGAAPTPLAWSELYTAMQQGVVDGQENPLQLINNGKFYEVQEYLSLTQHIFGSLSMLMSNKFFESLPDDLKTVVLESAADAQQWCWDEFVKTNEAVQQELSSKIKITELSAAQLKAFQDIEKKEAWPQIEETIGSEFYNEILDEITRIQNM